jgi:hypothetical protein
MSRSAVSGVLLVLMSGCSAAGERPLASSTDTEVSSETAPAAPVSNASSDALCAPDAVKACRVSIGTNRGFVLCADGEQSCQRGRWSSCTTSATSAGIDRWTPITEGCDAPPEPCTDEGVVRVCKHYLPAEPGLTNCYQGHQQCSSGAWTSCIQDEP